MIGTMPTLLIKRILARDRGGSPIALVAPFRPSQYTTAKTLEMPVASPLPPNRKQDVVEFESPQKRRRLFVDEQVTTAVAVVEPWLACEEMGSDYMKLMERCWKASASEFDAAFAQRRAAQTKTNLLLFEKALCEKVVQRARATLKAKDQELHAVAEMEKQAMATLISSFAETQAIFDEWDRWQDKGIDTHVLFERVASKGSHHVTRVSDGIMTQVGNRVCLRL